MSARIFVFELDLHTDLGAELKAILQARFLVSHRGCANASPDAPLGLSAGELTELCSTAPPAAVFLTSSSAAQPRVEAAVRWLQQEAAALPVLLATEAREAQTVARLLGLGVLDFVTAPLRSVDILPRLWRLLGPRERRAEVRGRRKEELGLGHLIGDSEVFLEVVAQIPLMARSDATVLILGETGTGKEICARAVHRLSHRSGKPFTPVNCGAIPLELIERELFGHQRAAFTGASSSQHGLIREAEGGTLFLDEIDALPPAAQVKLLRFLQEKEYRPLGSTNTRSADVRVIAATNTEVEEAIAQGRLRRDLYYRLNVLPLGLPPLRERREDIVPLTRHFIAKYAARHGRGTITLVPEALSALLVYDWPGNVRELEHVVERAIVLAGQRSVIRRSDVRLPSRSAARVESFKQAKARTVARFERTYIESLLVAHQGNISGAARSAQKNRRAFWELIRKHRIDADRFRSSVGALPA